MFASHICCTAQVMRDGTRCIDWCRSIATLVGWGRTCTSFRTPLHGQRRDLAAGGTMLCGRGTTMRLRSTIGAPHPTGRALATSHRCVCLQLCLRSVHRSRITPESAMTHTCSELLYVIQSGDCALANLLGIDGAGMVCAQHLVVCSGFSLTRRLPCMHTRMHTFHIYLVSHRKLVMLFTAFTSTQEVQPGSQSCAAADSVEEYATSGLRASAELLREDSGVGACPVRVRI